MGGKVAAAAYLLAGVIHLVLVGTGPEPAAVATQALLMPVLLLTAWRLGPAVIAALFFSWLGDTLPHLMAEGWRFPVLVGCFLVAQVGWISALWRRRRHSLLCRDRGWLAAYLLLGLGVVAVCAPKAGILTPLLVIYAGALLGTAVLGTGWGSRGLWGGLLFLASDAMIALFTFGPVEPAETPRRWVIMATYLAAQGLLVWAMTRIRRANQ